MDKIDLLTDELQVARLHQRQLKVTMDLPVRLVTGDQVVDVIPLPAKPGKSYKDSLGYKLSDHIQPVYYSIDQIRDFFIESKKDDLVSLPDLAMMFQVSLRTIQNLAHAKKLKCYYLTHSMTLAKLSELPEIITKD